MERPAAASTLGSFYTITQQVQETGSPIPKYGPWSLSGYEIMQLRQAFLGLLWSGLTVSCPMQTTRPVCNISISLTSIS